MTPVSGPPVGRSLGQITLLHYWLVSHRGGEAVLAALAELFPGAPVHTHVQDPALTVELLPGHPIHTSLIARLPWARRLYQSYLPLMPWACELLDLSDYDLVISSESGPIKGVVTRPDALHLCYCHSPMRYVWDLAVDYNRRARGPKRWLHALLLPWLRQWDRLSADRVDHFVANSQFVAQRIRKVYRREATVIHPPVDTDYFVPSSEPPQDFYLLVGQLVLYKRADLAVEACSRAGRPLVVIGTGEQERHLRRMAGPTVRFLGRQSREVIRWHYQHCRALLFPGLEDFGIVPVEAMACGRPVIAYGRGGATETVKPDVTGIWFPEQTVMSLLGAMEALEDHLWDGARIRQWAEGFGQQRFQQQFRYLLTTLGYPLAEPEPGTG